MDRFQTGHAPLATAFVATGVLIATAVAGFAPAFLMADPSAPRPAATVSADPCATAVWPAVPAGCTGGVTTVSRVVGTDDILVTTAGAVVPPPVTLAAAD